MANHLHRQIRDAMATALTGLVTTGANVFASRNNVIPEARLPALRIYFDGERADPLTMAVPHLQDRVPAFVVEACAKDVATLDDDLDQIALEVETALSGGISVDSRLLDVYYRGIDPLNDEQQANRPVGVKTMRFEIPYVSASNAPDSLAQ